MYASLSNLPKAQIYLYTHGITEPNFLLHIIEFFWTVNVSGNLVSGFIVAESLCRNQYIAVTVKVQVLVMILFLSFILLYGFNLKNIGMLFQNENFLNYSEYMSPEYMKLVRIDE